jgi:ATP-binding cassette subfamily F protein uup
MRYGVTGRRKRNMRRVGQLRALREQRRTHRGAAGNVAMTAGSAAPSGALVIEATGIGKSYGGRAIVSDFSIRIQRGDRIGIVGPNGSGKTTLIGMLTGALPPDTGTVRLGSNLAVATLDQHRDSLDPDVTVTEALTGGHGDTVMVNGVAKHVIGYMKDFLFASEQARTPLGKLSGGERGRLMLAQALARPSNLLVLDEPTNDLDMETLDVLEDMLGDYPGTVLLISHDRDFLDRLVSGVIVPEGNGCWTEYAGGYSDMLAQRGADLTREQHKPAPQKVAKEVAPAVAAAPAKQRMTFKDKHALETLPKTIAGLLAKADDLQAKLADPQFYMRDRAGFEKVTTDLGEAQRKLAAAEEQWLRLEIMREEFAAN